MFLYINKALGRNGKEQKEKPIIFTTWAVGESVNPYSGREIDGRLSNRGRWD